MVVEQRYPRLLFPSSFFMFLSFYFFNYLSFFVYSTHGVVRHSEWRNIKWGADQQQSTANNEEEGAEHEVSRK